MRDRLLGYGCLRRAGVLMSAFALAAPGAASLAETAPAPAPSPTVASATFLDEFNSFCLDGNATLGPALVAADKRHWVDVFPKPPQTGQEVYALARSAPLESGTQLMLLGEVVGRMNGVPTIVRSCTLVAMVDDHHLAVQLAEKIPAPIAPASADAESRLWIYAQTRHGPSELNNDRSAARAISSGAYRSFEIKEQKTESQSGLVALKMSVGISLDEVRHMPMRFYPKSAQAQSVEGSAELSCLVNVAGDLRSCTVKSENPAGFGFGEAALYMAPLLKMKPATQDGVPVQVPTTIPFNFKLPQ